MLNFMPTVYRWQSSSTGLFCGRISRFLDFSQDIRALQEARNGTVSDGGNRGGLPE